MVTEIDKLKREFLEYLEIEKGRAIRTVENYEHYLTVFFEFAKIKHPRRYHRHTSARISPYG